MVLCRLAVIGPCILCPANQNFVFTLLFHICIFYGDRGWWGWPGYGLRKKEVMILMKMHLISKWIITSCAFIIIIIINNIIILLGLLALLCSSFCTIAKIKTREMSVWAKFTKISSRENFYFYSISLMGYCTPNQKLACFVPYLKIINTFFEKWFMHLL